MVIEIPKKRLIVGTPRHIASGAGWHAADGRLAARWLRMLPTLGVAVPVGAFPDSYPSPSPVVSRVGVQACPAKTGHYGRGHSRVHAHASTA
jgi:hypothetical protein